MAFFNFAFNLFSSNSQSIGITFEERAQLVTRLDEALGKLFLTEEQKTEAFKQLAESQGALAQSQGELEAIVRVVSGFLSAIYREDIPPDQYTATFFRLAREWQTAGARIDALGQSFSLAPHVEQQRQAAQRERAAGNVAEAVRILDEIADEEAENERKLLEQQQALKEQQQALTLEI